MQHYVAHPGGYLIVRFRDGRKEHLPGPTEVWFDPREHLEVAKHDALQIAAKEAVVVYSKTEATGEIARRIEYGPAQFVPAPGEWLHTFLLAWFQGRLPRNKAATGRPHSKTLPLGVNLHESPQSSSSISVD